ncbi:MAG: DUF4124 domain-containing protein [Candidatus Sedimenticola sp. (ex Thyasira tokunagai)]
MASPTVTAGVYRWVDENGKVHFTDRQPPGQKTKQVKIRQLENGDRKDGVRTEAERKQLRQRLLDSYRQDREAKQEAAAKKKKEAHELEVRCIYAKDQLREYQNASGIYEPQADGSRKMLSKEDHAATIKRIKKSVERWCD